MPERLTAHTFTGPTLPSTGKNGSTIVDNSEQGAFGTFSIDFARCSIFRLPQHEKYDLNCNDCMVSRVCFAVIGENISLYPTHTSIGGKKVPDKLTEECKSVVDFPLVGKRDSVLNFFHQEERIKFVLQIGSKEDRLISMGTAVLNFKDYDIFYFKTNDVLASRIILPVLNDFDSVVAKLALELRIKVQPHVGIDFVSSQILRQSIGLKSKELNLSVDTEPPLNELSTISFQRLEALIKV